MKISPTLSISVFVIVCLLVGVIGIFVWEEYREESVILDLFMDQKKIAIKNLPRTVESNEGASLGENPSFLTEEPNKTVPNIVEEPVVKEASKSVELFFKIFGRATVIPEFTLDGTGTNIDSPEFFETTDFREMHLYVTGKGNEVIEVWQYPFRGRELRPLQRSSLPNGLAIEQERDWLLIGDSEKAYVAIYALPSLKHVKDLGSGKLKGGETNVDVLTRRDGGATIYVTDDHRVLGFDADSGKEVASIIPRVASIEEILIDDYHQIIYVPDEDGIESSLHRGGAVTAYHPDGRPYMKAGTNVLAQGVFGGDAEGAALYRCLNEQREDTGEGFLIFVDQGSSRINALEFFNRRTWKHLGTLVMHGVTMTDGIASTQQSFPEYPLGLLAAADSDKATAIISWEKIFKVTSLSCQ